MLAALAITMGLGITAPGSGYGAAETPFLAVLAAAADSSADASINLRPDPGAFRALPPPQRKLRFDAQRLGAVDRHRFRVRVRALAGRRVVASQDYDFAWKQPETVLVPTRPIARGERIAPSDLRAVVRDGARGDFVRRLDEVTGRAAKRALAPGRPFTYGDLKAQTLITRGSNVQVRVRHGGLVVSLKAQAMQSGGVGEQIRLLNPASRKMLVATVVGKDVAEVFNP